MSIFNPSEQTRAVVKFYAQVLQAAAIVLGGGWAVVNYHNQIKQQTQEALDHKDAVERELRKPYDEKQLNLYIEAARVVADLATLPEGEERQKATQRFWELYWGELAFVEFYAVRPAA